MLPGDREEDGQSRNAAGASGHHVGRVSTAPHKSIGIGKAGHGSYKSLTI